MPDWWLSYFGDDYWTFADDEYDSTRTQLEADYIVRVLQGAVRGRRVLDVGCGRGRHAIALAKAGFEVTGLDVSTSAIDIASARATEAGVEVSFVRADLMSRHALPVPRFDAVVMIQSFGWGSDADQRRILATLRTHLDPGGVLLLDHSSPSWILRNFSGTADAELNGTAFAFDRRFNAVDSKMQGSLQVTDAAGTRTYEHDIRLYSTREVVQLAQETGYDVEQVDADFQVGGPLDLETRYVQVVARRAARPAENLAISSYRDPIADDELDLRWTPDEANWVDAVLAADRSVAIPGAYAVDDPWGGRAGADAVRSHLGITVSDRAITFGGGVTSLLRSLGDLALGGTCLTIGPVHADYPAWIEARGGSVVRCDLAASAEATSRIRPSVVLIDRPSVDGEVISLDDLHDVCRRAAEAGAFVLVDESSANILGPGQSCAPIVELHDNLILLRSMSKGYGAGGLRVGYAISSSPLAGSVRDVVPPLGVASSSLEYAIGLLLQGDVFLRLRERVRSVKPAVVNALSALGLDPLPGHPDLPWLLFPPNVHARRQLSDRGIAVKTVSDRGCEGAARMSIPLDEQRRARCLHLLGAGPDHDDATHPNAIQEAAR